MAGSLAAPADKTLTGKGGMVMKRKSLTAAAFLLSVIVVALAATLIFTACNNGEKTSWTIAADGGEIKAYFSDNGRYGYVLNLEGEGAIPDYSLGKGPPLVLPLGQNYRH